MESYKRNRLDSIADDEDRIIQDMRTAYLKYGDRVASRVVALQNARLTDGKYHRVFCIVKGMLSAGLKLDLNIAAAHVLTRYMIQHGNPSSSDTESMIGLLRDEGLFEGRSPGQAVKNIADASDFILRASDSDMTYGHLIRIRGIGPKIASWVLSLYFGNVRRFTLDVHMFRGLFGTGSATTDNVHQQAEEVLLQWCERDFPGVPPLVIQWSVWCMYRGDVWDNHDGIIRAEV